MVLIVQKILENQNTQTSPSCVSPSYVSGPRWEWDGRVEHKASHMPSKPSTTALYAKGSWFPNRYSELSIIDLYHPGLLSTLKLSSVKTYLWNLSFIC